MQVRSLGREDPLEDGMATHSSILAWRIPWTEWPGRLQSMGLQREGHNWSDLAPTQLLQRLNLIKIRSKLLFKYTYFILIYMEKQSGGEVLPKMYSSEEELQATSCSFLQTSPLCKDINHCPLRQWGSMSFSRYTFRICLKSTPVLSRSKSYSCVQGISPCPFLCFILPESQGYLLWNAIAHSLTQIVFILK